VPRTRQIPATHGHGRERAVTVDGWKPIVWIEAMTPMPLAIQGVPRHAPDGRSRQALVTQARAPLMGVTRRHQGVGARGCGAGAALWGLDHQGITGVGPATDHLAVTAEARAPAAAGAGITVGRRVHTRRPGQGTRARTARQEPAVVGRAGLTTADPDGTPEPGRHRHRRDGEAHPIPAVVVRPWPGRDDGPGGTPVCLTHAAVQQPWPPVEDEDDRRCIEPCGINAATPPWDLGHPPQHPGRAVHVHGLVTVWMCALATAYRRPGEPAQRRAAPVGWQRWRRQRLEPTRDQSIVWAQRWSGLVPLAAFALRVGGKRNDVPPGIGTRHAVLANDRLTGHE